MNVNELKSNQKTIMLYNLFCKNLCSISSAQCSKSEVMLRHRLHYVFCYAKEMELETINFGCNNTEAASKLNTVLNTIGPNFDLFKTMKKMGCFPHFKSTNFDNSFFPFYAILKRLEFGYTV